MHRHGGPGRGKADQDSLTQAEERTHLCRNLRAQRAERRAQSALANCSLSRFGSLAQRIRSGKSAGKKKIDREKLASFGPLCLSSDSTRCQESESLSDFQTRRAVRPYFQLPFWTLYFRHYEVGAPCRRAYVWWQARPFMRARTAARPIRTAAFSLTFAWPFQVGLTNSPGASLDHRAGADG